MNVQIPLQTIVVTGGAGFIGTHLCAALVQQGHTVKVIDLKSPTNAVAGVQYIQGNVCDRALLESEMINAHTIYHLAATVSVPVCQNEPFESYVNNFQTTLTVLETLRKQNRQGHKPTRLVFASTAAIYANKGQQAKALKESDTASEFSSFYAAQKHASEQAISLYAKSFAIPSLAFRFFNVFGPGQDPSSPYSGVISIFSKLVKEGKPLPLHGGGHQTRDFISVHDLVDALMKALGLTQSHWQGQTINLGTGTPTSIKELAQTLQEIEGTSVGTTMTEPRPADVLHSVADISEAKKLLDFSPKISLTQGLKEILFF